MVVAAVGVIAAVAIGSSSYSGRSSRVVSVPLATVVVVAAGVVAPVVVAAVVGAVVAVVAVAVTAWIKTMINMDSSNTTGLYKLEIFILLCLLNTPRIEPSHKQDMTDT